MFLLFFLLFLRDGVGDFCIKLNDFNRKYKELRIDDDANGSIKLNKRYYI